MIDLSYVDVCIDPQVNRLTSRIYIHGNKYDEIKHRTDLKIVPAEELEYIYCMPSQICEQFNISMRISEIWKHFPTENIFRLKQWFKILNDDKNFKFILPSMRFYEFEDIIEWCKKWHKRGIYFAQFIQNMHKIRKYNPKNYREYYVLKNSNWNELATSIRRKLNKREIMCLKSFGIIDQEICNCQWVRDEVLHWGDKFKYPVLKKIIKILKELDQNTKLQNIIKSKINDNLWLHSEGFMKFIQDPTDFKNLFIEFTITDLIALGITHKELFPMLTQKERHDFININENIKYFREIPTGYFHRFFNISDAISIHINTGINTPTTTTNITIDSKFITLLKWCKRNEDKLNKPRQINGQNIYDRVRLEYVNPEILKKAEFTSYRKVIESTNDEMRKRLQLQFGKNRKLPIVNYDFKKFPEIKQITQSGDMIVEGNIMSHCVASYILPCLQKRSYIFHIGKEAPDGATFELKRMKRRWSGVQCKGFLNSQPSSEIIVGYKQFIDYLNELEIEKENKKETS